MSVWTSAIIGHQWGASSLKQITHILSIIPSETGAPQKRLVSESGSAEQDFAEFGAATFLLSQRFMLKVGRQIIVLIDNKKWSGLLMDQATRQDFLSVCYKISNITGASKILLLPEGTVLEELLYENLDFDSVKKRAQELWGPPDLDVNCVYSGEDLHKIGSDRIHYMLINVPEL